MKRLSGKQKGGKYDKFVHVINSKPNTSNYKIDNNRSMCSIHGNSENCNSNPHCHWSHNSCYFTVTKNMLVEFINKITNEFVENSLKSKELLKIDRYNVSDIVDFSKFTQKEGQTIVRSNNANMNKVLKELFGKDNIPVIGKNKLGKIELINDQQLNITNPLRDMKNYYIQNIIDNNISLYRAVVNGYYWIKHKFYDTDNRNLGYYNEIQTDIANYFKSIVLDWLIDKKHKDHIEKLSNHIESTKSNKINDFITKVSNNIQTLNDCVIELDILSRVIKINIIVYNIDNSIIYIFDNGLIYSKFDKNKFKDKYNKYKDKSKRQESINIKFNFILNKNVPNEIYSIYYK